MTKKITLSNMSTLAPHDFDKKEAKRKTKEYVQGLTTLQRILISQSHHSLLLILQGMDASGKDGAVRNVFSKVSPSGCKVKSFKKPTPEEMGHDFLWRVHQHTPRKGMIQIFNRSHYEDVLIQRVHHWIDDETVISRYKHINNFEGLLTENGVTIVKVFLHVSKEKQLERLNERIELPSKKWKHNPNDMKEREHWDTYMTAYEDAFVNCSKVPWHIIPSDQNWYKEYLLSKIVKEALESMRLSY